MSCDNYRFIVFVLNIDLHRIHRFVSSFGKHTVVVVCCVVSRDVLLSAPVNRGLPVIAPPLHISDLLFRGCV